LRFWQYVSFIAASFAALATLLVYLPKIASDTIPYLATLFASTTPRQYENPGGDRANGDIRKDTKSPNAQPDLDDRYVLPAGVTTTEFTQCLSTKALVDGRDFTIKEVSSVYRVLIPTRHGNLIATAYDECRDRLRR
jgi:hypothetical protein